MPFAQPDPTPSQSELATCPGPILVVLSLVLGWTAGLPHFYKLRNQGEDEFRDPAREHRQVLWRADRLQGPDVAHQARAAHRSRRAEWGRQDHALPNPDWRDGCGRRAGPTDEDRHHRLPAARDRRCRRGNDPRPSAGGISRGGAAGGGA